MNLLSINNYAEYIEFEFGEFIRESLTITIFKNIEKNDTTYTVEVTTDNLGFNYHDVQRSVKKARELFHFIINQQG